MKKKIVSQLVLIVATLGVLFGLFYFFSLRPKMNLPGRLLSTEKVISVARLSLLQSRLSIMSLVNLSPSNPNLATQKAEALSLALETNEEGLRDLSIPKKIQTPPGKEFEFLNDLNTQLPLLMEENRELYDNQKKFLETLSELSNINKNIYAYNPLVDLALLDLQSEQEELIVRFSNAIEGLETIKNGLESYPKAHLLRQEITVAQELLQTQITQVENGQTFESSLTFKEVVTSFAKLRQLGLDMEFDIIKSTKMIALLTDQTNLILKYEFWLKKIDEAQQKLPKLDFNTLF